MELTHVGRGACGPPGGAVDRRGLRRRPRKPSVGQGRAQFFLREPDALDLGKLLGRQKRDVLYRVQRVQPPGDTLHVAVTRPGPLRGDECGHPDFVARERITTITAGRLGVDHLPDGCDPTVRPTVLGPTVMGRLLPLLPRSPLRMRSVRSTWRSGRRPPRLQTHRIWRRQAGSRLGWPHAPPPPPPHRTWGRPPADPKGESINQKPHHWHGLIFRAASVPQEGPTVSGVHRLRGIALPTGQ